MNKYFDSRALDQKRPKSVDKVMTSNVNVNSNSGKFHVVMQQLGLAIPIDEFIVAQPQIKKWADVAKQYINIPGNKRWNVDLSHEFNGAYLIENYDFIVSNNDKTIAIDWTIEKPSDFDELEKSWKTQLRLFLLHKNSSVKCEDVSLIYIFVDCGTIYQCCYDTEAHKENIRSLGAIIEPPTPVEVEDNTINPLSRLHEDWLAGKITVQEYFNAIPEIRL